MPTIRIMLIGARLFAEALAVSLKSAQTFEVISVHADPLAALDGVRATEPDVVVLDDTRPHLDAVRLAGLLRAAHRDVRILVLSASGDEQAMASYVRAGVMGCVTIDRALEELIESI